MSIGSTQYHERIKGGNVSEIVADMKEEAKKGRFASLNNFTPLRFKKYKTHDDQFRNPILHVDENGKVLINRIWECGTEGYYRYDEA